MIELENYKSNLDVVDKYNLKKVKIVKGTVYAGNTEYINPQIKEREHTSTLLASAILGLDNTAAPIHEDSDFSNIWTDIDAQEIYLNKKPTCYLILGKAGAGSFNLGEAIAEKYKCIHLSPRNILVDEISQKSSTGRTLDFNMKQNNVCLFDMIITMLKIKLNSEVVQHRGYVLSGFPLVTCSRSPLCYINSLYGEDAFLEMDELLFDVICNLKKKKPKRPTESTPSSINSNSFIAEDEEEEEPIDDQQADAAVEEAVEEEEDQPAKLPKFELNSCSNVIIHKKPHFQTKQAVILYQLQEIFNLSLKPDIIIHMTCPELALVALKSNKHINYKTDIYTNKPIPSNYVPEVVWPAQYGITDCKIPRDSHYFDPKYNCKPPTSFVVKNIEQICNYRTYVIPYLEKKMKDFDPKMVIVLDGRNVCSQMLYNVSERLILLHVLPVIVPEPLFLDEIPEDMNEFWETVADLNVIRSGVVNFNYYPSPWFNRCPVELKLRRTVIGLPKYAVMFFKHVYLMSSHKHFISFCRNPRPYLKIKYLEPTCRVIVTGTEKSGKSMISQCLSWIFDAPIIHFKPIVQTENERKYNAFAKSILSEIIPIIEDARFLEWQRIESIRITELNEWCSSALKLLNKYILLLEKIKKYEEKQANILLLKKKEKNKKTEKIPPKITVKKEKPKEVKEILGEEEEDEKSIDEEMYPASLTKLDALRMHLSFLPILDSIEECQAVIVNQNISQYAPIELTTTTTKPLIPVMGDEDVTIAIAEYIVANNLQKEVEPTIEEYMTIIIGIITAIDTQHQEETQFDQLYGKYIIDDFPLDPEYWGFLDPKIMPDYTIALIENREIDEDLYQYYNSVHEYTKHYDKTIFLANDPLIHTKKRSEKNVHLQDIDMHIIVKNMIDDILDYLFITKNKSVTLTEDTETTSQTQFITSFTEAIEKFREDWDSTKLKLEEKSKCYIEIELENKTDVEIIEAVLLKLRQSYRPTGKVNEDGELEISDEDEDDTTTNDHINHNDPYFFCDTNIYCPIAYYDYHILWEGKPEFSLKYDNKIHYFCKEEFLELFQKNTSIYQFYNKPYKKIPKFKICVIGCVGSGTTSLSKYIAKEIGLLHIDFLQVINETMMPRHYKKIGRYYENIFLDEPLEDEAVVDFQMNEENENLLSDVLGNEKETRRMFTNYFERAAPILPQLTQKFIKKVWFDLYSSIGFVLDGYPRLINDIEDMLACYCIPDMVIQLECTLEDSISRIVPMMLKKWKSQQNEAKRVAAVKLANERKLWMDTITQKIVTKLIIEEIFDSICFSTPEVNDNSQPVLQPVEDVIVDTSPSESPNVDPILFKEYNEMIEQYPEPKDTNEWETIDKARERLEARVEVMFDADMEHIEQLKEVLTEHRIKFVTINASKSFEKVTRNTLTKLIDLKNRCESVFEQTFIVTPDIANILLSKGFYFLSKFYRVCPVYIFENPHAIQNSYKISKRKGTLFPVIHRSLIYYICSEENVIKFRTNPLKYITSDAVKSYIEYPLRISVIGTPKSGQSTLAARLANEYGLLCLSRGQCIRSILENLYWTELGRMMLEKIEAGNKIGRDQIMQAIQSLAVDHRTVTYGFVYDGFPATPYEAKFLAKNGLFPNVIFDICSDESKVLENSQNEIHYDILKYMPPYSCNFIKMRLENWKKRQRNVRSWIDEDYQNIFRLNGNTSKWHVFQQANDHLTQLISKIYFYITNVENGIVRTMWISTEMFEERQSQYKQMCPVCFHKKIYKHMGGYKEKKTGIVQYRYKFYWICEDHIDSVMEYPNYYLTSRQVVIPEVPAVIRIINIDYIHENGICVVTYAENLPAQIIKMGTGEFAASYAGKSYLFCSEICLRKFLYRPYLYKDINVFKETKLFSKVSLNKLPNIGYLEQTLGNILTEACCSVNVFRPKYPGLSFTTSAMIYVALYLKTHNPNMDKAKIPTYLNALRVFEARCKLILSVGLRLRSMENPFATYPKCLHREPTLDPVNVEQEHLSSLEIQKPLTIRHKTCNFVQMHKPSYVLRQRRRSTVTGQMKRD